MENKGIDLKELESVKAPVRAQILKSLTRADRERAVGNLVECAMRMGIMDAYEIRLWLGLHKHSVRIITNHRDKIRKRWLEDIDDVASQAASERVIQIKKVWEEIRNCEELYKEAKSVGDKIKVKQLQLQYLQYVAKLNFVDSAPEEEKSPTINIISASSAKNESN